jgi:hypothetical protein
MGFTLHRGFESLPLRSLQQERGECRYHAKVTASQRAAALLVFVQGESHQSDESRSSASALSVGDPGSVVTSSRVRPGSWRPDAGIFKVLRPKPHL